jgi:single-stranded-DNA-specific exonuclease
MAYLFAKTLDENNQDLAHFAIIGALGDMQNRSGGKEEFLSPNREILEEAIKKGKIELTNDIAISRTRPLPVALANTLPEDLPGISRDENAAKRFLESRNIKFMTNLGDLRTLQDLTLLEKRDLSKAIMFYALNTLNLDLIFIQKLFRTFYILKEFEEYPLFSEGRELSSILNACSRRGHPSLAFSILFKQKENFDEALAEVKEYRREIAIALQWADDHLIYHKNIISLYGGDAINEKKIGSIATIVLNNTRKVKKPIIAYAESGKDMFKISTRAPHELVEKGLDLGAVLRKVTVELGLENPGGGHAPAAGAKIPQAKLKDFLTLMDNFVGEMIGSIPIST